MGTGGERHGALIPTEGQGQLVEQEDAVPLSGLTPLERLTWLVLIGEVPGFRSRFLCFLIK